MLKLLGVIYYLLAALAIFVGLGERNSFGGGMTLAIGLAAGLSFAFFGAMCWVADDMRALLARIADQLAPERTPAAAAGQFKADDLKIFRTAAGNLTAAEAMERYAIARESSHYVLDGREFGRLEEAIGQAEAASRD